MSTPKVDHVALEVGDIDHRIETLVGTGAFKVLREGRRMADLSKRIVMLGDGTGFKLELIESDRDGASFEHVALRVSDVDETHGELLEKGWVGKKGPNELAPALARTAQLCDTGFNLQIISYASNSPDMVVWND